MDRCNIRLFRERAAIGTDAAGGLIIDKAEDKGNAEVDQETAILSMLTANRSSAVVLLNGAPIDMSEWISRADAVLEAWYPGEMGAQAITEILFGLCCPSGKLPISFPRSVGQLPLYYAHKTSGRGYGYHENDGSPLFEFGYGLTLTVM